MSENVCDICKSTTWNFSLSGLCLCNKCLKKKLKENNGVIENEGSQVIVKGSVIIDGNNIE